jgi:hypothetical protein
MKVVINDKPGGFQLSELGIEFCRQAGLEVKWPDRDKKETRTHPALVQLATDLPEDGFDRVCRPKVVEIPFDTLDGWHIAENDCGEEWIAEDHRTWE